MEGPTFGEETAKLGHFFVDAVLNGLGDGEVVIFGPLVP
jgi:hypothetical protein